MKSRVRTFVCFIIFLVLCLTLVSCNSDTSSSSEEQPKETRYAMIVLPSGEVIEGEFEDRYISYYGTYVSIKVDGVWYTTSFLNVCIIRK